MFKREIGRWLLALAACALLPAGTARAEAVVDSDSRAVRAVIEGQLKALADGQAEQAFSFAAPAIRELFGSAEVFIAMVRQSYAMLIRPSALSFFQPEGVNDVVTQGLQFRDTEGRLWRAVYELRRQPDKRWRISACVVRPSDESSIS